VQEVIFCTETEYRATIDGADVFTIKSKGQMVFPNPAGQEWTTTTKRKLTTSLRNAMQLPNLSIEEGCSNEWRDDDQYADITPRQSSPTLSLENDCEENDAYLQIFCRIVKRMKNINKF
jgi:hypothetical protein